MPFDSNVDKSRYSGGLNSQENVHGKHNLVKQQAAEPKLTTYCKGGICCSCLSFQVFCIQDETWGSLQ